MTALASSVNVSLRTIPSLDIEAFVMENKGEGVKNACDVAFFYLSEEAFRNMKISREIVLRPLHTLDVECLQSATKIKENSRLAAIHFYPNGNVHLVLRKPVTDALQGKPLKAVKIQEWRNGEQASLQSMKKIDGIAAAPEPLYIRYTGAFDELLKLSAKFYQNLLGNQ